MAMQIIAIKEMTKQMQGSMMRVNNEELKLSARRQSQMIQKELRKRGSLGKNWNREYLNKTTKRKRRERTQHRLKILSEQYI